MILGIDASNIKTGGGLTHCLEIINNKSYIDSGFEKVVIWSNKNTLDKIIDDKSIIKKTSYLLNKNFLIRALWNLFFLKNELIKENCRAVFILGGYSFTNFKPMITISHNLLPFSPIEIKNYGFSLQATKLRLLSFFLKNTFNKCDGLIYLSQYASSIIHKQLKKSVVSTVIGHGINKSFYNHKKVIQKPITKYSYEKPIKAIYVSTIDMYKHQWNVAKAIEKLRCNGYPITIDFIGGNYYHALKKFNKSIKKIFKNREFIKYHGEISYNKLNEYYNKSDLIIFASSCENLPIIVLECMATGLPIVSSSCGPMPEILKNNVQYFDPYKVDSIYNAVKSDLDDHINREINVKKLIEDSKKYDWTKVSKDTFNFIFRIVESKK